MVIKISKKKELIISKVSILTALIYVFLGILMAIYTNHFWVGIITILSMAYISFYQPQK